MKNSKREQPLGNEASIHFLDAKESEEFWRRHAESRRKLDEEYAKLPLKERIKLREKMRANHKVIRESKHL